MTRKKTLGIIQTRGLGDLIIALPIAGYYRDRGWTINWPVLEEFVPSMQAMAPWVNWIPVKYDPPGRYFYDVPYQILNTSHPCDEILPLYQALTNHPEFSAEPYFQTTSFDQYKYIRAGVPFLKKWTLEKYIVRNRKAEQALYDLKVTNPKYAVVHLAGSDFTGKFDSAIIPEDWQTITIEPEPGYNITDWLKILEGAQSIICVDSVYSNLVDQLNIGTDRYFIQRSHIGLTPVHGQDWHWL